jgi:hypothetical protein
MRKPLALFTVPVLPLRTPRPGLAELLMMWFRRLVPVATR